MSVSGARNNANFVVDLTLWFFSVFISSIPVLVKQFFNPPKELVNLSFFLRVLSDLDFAYVFLCAGVVLVFQVLLTMRENEYIKNTFIRFLSMFCLGFYFFAAIMYNISSLVDYSSINELLQNSEISGSVLEANTAIIITTLIISFTIGFLHCIPKRK